MKVKFVIEVEVETTSEEHASEAMEGAFEWNTGTVLLQDDDGDTIVSSVLVYQHEEGVPYTLTLD